MATPYLALPARHPKKDSEIGLERVKNGILKFTTEKKKISAWNATAYNERFCVIAAVNPQIMQCELANYYPAGSSVEAATAPSRHHVINNGGTFVYRVEKFWGNFNLAMSY